MRNKESIGLAPAGPGGNRWAAAIGDAVAVILLCDAVLSLHAPDRSIGWIFFHLPGWAPLAGLLPAIRAYQLSVLKNLTPIS